MASLSDEFREEARLYLRSEVGLPEFLAWVNSRLFADASSEMRKVMDSAIMIGDEIADQLSTESDLRAALEQVFARDVHFEVLSHEPVASRAFVDKAASSGANDLYWADQQEPADFRVTAV